MSSAEFFKWWGAHLATFIPRLLRRRWGPVKASITLSVEGDRLQISLADTGLSATADLSGDRPAQQTSEVAALLADLPGGPQQIKLVLGPHDYLLRHINLPRAAQGSLVEAVGYQLPQLTPFTADQLLYACGENESSPSSGPLSVWLVAVPRQRVEKVMQVIDLQVPENPLHLDSPPAANESLTLRWGTDLSASSQRSMRFAWVVLVLLWFGVFGIHMVRQEQQQQLLDETLDEMRSSAAVVIQLHERLSMERERLELLTHLKAHGSLPLTLLERLSVLLDDETWLQGLDLHEGELILHGVSVSPTGLLEKLEATEILEDVRFDSAITRDGRSEGDRFNIRANLEKPVRSNEP